MNKVFKIVLLVIGLMLCRSFEIQAQQDHFVYIQSDEKVPFDVSVNGKTYNSSSLGYVIVPKLTKGNYQFNVSFANKKYPDQQFSCAIDKLDAGYLLKNYDEKGWGLFNLQSSDIIMAGSAAGAADETPKTEPKNNAFANMLSQVSGDTTLNLKTEVEKPVAQKALPFVDSATIVKSETIPEQEDSITSDYTKTDISTKDVAVAQLKISPSVFPISGMIKVNEFTTNQGTDVVFIDTTAGLNDTIRIFLPAQTVLEEVAQAEIKTEEKKEIPYVTDKKDSAQFINNDPIAKNKDTVEATEENDGVNNPFFTKEEQKNAATNKEVDNDSKGKDEVATTQTIDNAQSVECKNMLSENDMGKLRKKMITADSDDKMISVVKKILGDKCMSTEQVKSLSGLFLSDDGRLTFFSSVYPSVNDQNAFSSLETQLIDPNYKKRFRDLIK